MFNIFNYLIAGFLYLLKILVYPLLFWVTEKLAFGMPIDQNVKYYAMVALDLFAPILTVLDFTLPVIAISIWAIGFIGQLILFVYNFILEIIPGIGR